MHTAAALKKPINHTRPLITQDASKKRKPPAEDAQEEARLLIKQGCMDIWSLPSGVVFKSTTDTTQYDVTPPAGLGKVLDDQSDWSFTRFEVDRYRPG